MFAALFAVLFLVGAIALLLVGPSGSAHAGLSSGFMLPTQDASQVAALLMIGLIASWLGREAITILPICALLMLIIGAMMHIDDHQFPAVRDFIAGAIILFAFGVSMLRNKAHLLFIPPAGGWMYFAGNGYMQQIPSVTTPLFFLLGVVISASLIIAIGISVGIALTDNIQDVLKKFKTLPRVSTFLSLF